MSAFPGWSNKYRCVKIKLARSLPPHTSLRTLRQQKLGSTRNSFRSCFYGAHEHTHLTLTGSLSAIIRAWWYAFHYLVFRTSSIAVSKAIGSEAIWLKYKRFCNVDVSWSVSDIMTLQSLSKNIEQKPWEKTGYKKITISAVFRPKLEEAQRSS